MHKKRKQNAIHDQNIRNFHKWLECQFISNTFIKENLAKNDFKRKKKHVTQYVHNLTKILNLSILVFFILPKQQDIGVYTSFDFKGKIIKNNCTLININKYVYYYFYTLSVELIRQKKLHYKFIYVATGEFKH